MLFSDYFFTFLLAMAPISEVRGAIPAGVLAFGLPFWNVFFVSLLGNLVSVFLLLLLLEPVSVFLSKKSKFFKKLIDWIFERTRKKVNSRVEKYEKMGLVLFVATPLPFTGGVTGSIAAFLLGIPFKKAFSLISFGVLIASVIVSFFTLSGMALRNYFGFESFFWVLLFFLITFLIYKLFKKSKQI